MRILVTGATGFIGARLLSKLAVECDELRILRRPHSPVERLKNIKYEEVIGDIRDSDVVRRAVEGCDVVFHVAAAVSYWDKYNKRQYEVNVIGTRNIVNACLACGVKRLIHTSSVVAIGAPAEGELADEKTEYNISHLKINYAETKHLGEEEVRKGIALGLDAVIVNPGAVFGPGDTRRYRGSLYGGRVWMHKFYVGGGIATVDVDDVVEGHIRAWKHGKKGERYILANENLTFRQIGEMIGSFLNWPKPTICVPSSLLYVLAYLATWFSWATGTKPIATLPMAKFTRLKLFYSNEKAKKELGMQFKPFKESVENAVEWFKEHGYL